MNLRNSLSVIPLVFCALLAGMAQAMPVYDITYLRPPAGASHIFGTAINDARQVTGFVTYNSGEIRAFVTPAITNVFDATAYASDPTGSVDNLYYRGAVALGTLGGRAAQAWDINSAGQVTGTSNLTLPDGSLTTHAFVTDPATNALIDVNAAGANGAGINDSGQLTGDVSSAGANSTRSTRLIDYEATGRASGINNLGQMTGSVLIRSTGRRHAFLWDPAGGMTDLGVLLPSASHSVFHNSEGVAINDRGQVTGNAEVRVFNPTTGRTRVYQHAFAWDAINGMVDLGSLDPLFPRDTYGRDINNAGQIVGASETRSGVKAFLWEDGVMYNLNELINPDHPLSVNIGGWGGYNMGINNRGDIIVDNMLLVRRGAHHAVPEPSSLLLILLGLFMVGAARVVIHHPRILHR